MANEDAKAQRILPNQGERRKVIFVYIFKKVKLWQTK